MEEERKKCDVRTYTYSEINENGDEIDVIEICDSKDLDLCDWCDCDIVTCLTECPLNE